MAEFKNIPSSASAPVSILEATILFNSEGVNHFRDNFVTCLGTSFYLTRVHFAQIARIPTFEIDLEGTGIDQNRGQLIQMSS